MSVQLQCKKITGGKVEGEILATTQGISFWGGVDAETGVLLEKGHELCNLGLGGTVLVFPQAKGSAGAAPVIVELCRNNKAPLAIVNLRTDPVIAAGAVISKQFYDKDIPIVNVDPETLERLNTGAKVCVDADNQTITIIQ